MDNNVQHKKQYMLRTTNSQSAISDLWQMHIMKFRKRTDCVLLSKSLLTLVFLQKRSRCQLSLEELYISNSRAGRNSSSEWADVQACIKVLIHYNWKTFHEVGHEIQKFKIQKQSSVSLHIRKLKPTQTFQWVTTTTRPFINPLPNTV